MRQREQCVRAVVCIGFRPCGCPKSFYVLLAIAIFQVMGGVTYAVKSADAVAAFEASGLNLACQTAPLWPMNVPILFGQLRALHMGISRLTSLQ